MRIVGGIWQGRALTSPGKRVRPTREDVRARCMQALGDALAGARVLDLFAGTGALGIEALSRGAAAADFVEFGPSALHALKANVAALRLSPLERGQRPTAKRKAARVFKRDALPFVARLDAGAYDVAFADPPYGSKKLDRIVERWQAVPFAGLLCVEHAPDHAVPRGVDRLVFDVCHVTLYRAP